jgi:nucleotide-binding universal stress UspA family protein
MGTEKGYNLLDYLMGKNTRKVIDKVGCPVISVRNPGQEFRPGKMVMPLDGNMDKEKGANMKPIKEMAGMYGSTIHLLNILPEQENNTEEMISQMEELASKSNLHNYTLNVVHNEDPIKAINSFCKKKKAGMIAVKYDESGFFRRIFVSNYIDEILNESQVPVLAFHDKR